MKNRQLDTIKKEFINRVGDENKKDNLQENNSPLGNADSQDGSKEKRNISIYKEIKFKPTPSK